MLLASNDTGERIAAAAGLAAKCPVCQEPVIPKCGAIKVHHWAHRSGTDCDPWSEPETEWHAGWKRCFPEARQEVVRGDHRADIFTAVGWVIELQHSSIAPDQIVEREVEYGKIVWVINSAPFLRNIAFQPASGHVKFRWARPRLSWSYAGAPLYLDTRDGWLFRIHKMTDSSPVRGWGRFVSTARFLIMAGAVRALDTEIRLEAHCAACSRNAALMEPRADYSSSHKAQRQCRFCRGVSEYENIGEAYGFGRCG